LGASVILFARAAGEMHVNVDDRQMMAVSRELAAGQWSVLLAPQDVHVIPLLRLARLYFDLGFPHRFGAMFWVALGAHLTSVVLLFLLARPYLLSPWSALATAVLFAWNTLGGAAFIIRSQYNYILSLPFLLGAVLCLRWFGATGARRWTLAAALCLLAAVGLHSIPGVVAIPGVLGSFYLLRTGPAASSRAVWIACAVPAFTGLVLWLGWCLPVLPPGHIFGGAKLAGATLETLRHFAFLVRQNTPGPGIMLGASAALLLLLITEREHPAGRWILAAAALCVPPAFVILQDRQPEAYNVSRYTYHSFLLVAVAAGVAVDAVLARCRRPAWRATLLGLLVLAAPAYWRRDQVILDRMAALLRSRTDVPREFWLAWNGFFEQTSERALAAGNVFRLPPAPVSLTASTDEVFAICNPRGRTAIRVLAREETRPEDCERFWQEVHRFEPTRGPLARALAGAPAAGSACGSPPESVAGWFPVPASKSRS
jgi:hypothetical protein